MDSFLLKSFIPEIFLSLVILFQLVYNAFLIHHSNYNFPIINKEILGQFIFSLSCLFLLLLNSKIECFGDNFLFFNDGSTRYIKVLFISSCIISVFAIIKSFKLQKLNFFEYFSLLLLIIFSAMLLISSGDMISTYLVLEMQALAFYILASFRRNSTFSTEAGLKYFIFGSFISGVFLFGCSTIYGILGTLEFFKLNLILLFPFENHVHFTYYLFVLGYFFIIVTFLFKLSSVPFHFWSPDVYEGAPLVSTIIFSIIPKFSLFTILIRILNCIPESFSEIYMLLMFSGLLSIFWGTFFAIRQKRLKKLMIYSSIAQVGFLITVLSSFEVSNIVAVYFFLIIYIITSALVWNHISSFYFFQKTINSFDNIPLYSLFFSSLSNFFIVNKTWSLSLIIIFFSIAGIPPLSGFFAKLFIIFSLLNSGKILSSILIVIISSISVFYYLRVIKASIFESNKLVNIKNNIQVIFLDAFSLIDYLGISLLLFLLIYFFFNPFILFLLAQNIVLNSYLFI